MSVSGLPPGVPLSEIPSGAPPPGVVSNFIDPPDQNARVIGVCVVMLTLVTIFISVRIYTNFFVSKKIGWDDYCCVLAVILSIVYTSLGLTQLKFYRHSWDRPLSWYTPWYFKISFTQDLFLGPSIFFAKLAILLLYHRVFSVSKQMRWAIYLGSAFAICLYWVNIPITAIYCAPRVGKPWAFDIGENCAHSIILGLVQGSLNVAFDFFIILLPVPCVLALNLPFRRKLAVLAVFMSGILGIATSILGLAYRVRLFLAQKTDSGWFEGIIFICVTVETDVAIMVSCMPSFASFSKAHVTNWDFFSISRARLVSLFKSNPATTPRPVSHRQDESTSNLREAGAPYYELKDGPWAKSGGDSEIVTNVRVGEAGRGAHLDHGLIKKSMDFSQSSQTEILEV